MKGNVTKSKETGTGTGTGTGTVSESALLSLVASKLKGRNLFPEKVEAAKKYLQKVKIASH